MYVKDKGRVFLFITNASTLLDKIVLYYEPRLGSAKPNLKASAHLKGIYLEVKDKQ